MTVKEEIRFTVIIDSQSTRFEFDADEKKDAFACYEYFKKNDPSVRLSKEIKKITIYDDFYNGVWR